MQLFLRKRNLKLIKEDPENATVSAGQIVGMVKEIKSVQEIIEDTMATSQEVYRYLEKINKE